jgi:hypothetical protein
MAAMEKVCARPPTPQAASIHQIHAAEGAVGFTTMVAVFGKYYLLVVCFLSCESSVRHVLPTF